MNKEKKDIVSVNRKKIIQYTYTIKHNHIQLVFQVSENTFSRNENIEFKYTAILEFIKMFLTKSIKGLSNQN